jgi:hypothetical protein
MLRHATQSRRGFLAMLPVVLVAVGSGRSWAQSARKKPHPVPRKGIDASRVVAAKDVDGDKAAVEAFDLVREIPQVVDGIRCSCGCESIEGFYSLLSCFEGDGMAAHCEVCQEHARLIHTLHRQGKTLKQIRAAVDAKFS